MLPEEDVWKCLSGWILTYYEYLWIDPDMIYIFYINLPELSYGKGTENESSSIYTGKVKQPEAPP